MVKNNYTYISIFTEDFTVFKFFETVTSEFGYIAPLMSKRDALSIILICLAFVAIALIAYFLGSINFAIIISSIKYKDDIRGHGSKNAGMTNMMRTYGKKAAAITLIGDSAKAIVACIVGYLIMGQFGAFAAGLFCMLGHIFPIYYGFKGGKGVATAFTAACMTDPVAFLIIILLFIIMVAIWRYISLASITCFGLYPLILAFTSKLFTFIVYKEARISIGIPFAVLMAALIIFKHWGNIQRLREGTESKFKFKKSVKAPSKAAQEDNTSSDGEK